MSHVTQNLRKLSPAKVDTPARNVPDGVAWVGILNKTGQPGLFVPEVRPGSRVFFGTLSTEQPVEVCFDRPSPFVDGRTQIQVLPGPPIPLTVRPDAAGEFRFSFRDPKRIRADRLLILDVSASGSSSRLDFLATSTLGAIAQSYVPTASGEVEVLIQNDLDRGARVSLDGPDREAMFFSVESGTTLNESILSPAFGRVLQVQLESAIGGDAQSGGTEQVEIILEPD